jgi:hypothetical protein
MRDDGDGRPGLSFTFDETAGERERCVCCGAPAHYQYRRGEAPDWYCVKHRAVVEVLG